MIIYGIALVSLCVIIGEFIGISIGYITGLNVDVGGIGIAMILLMLISNYFSSKGYKFHELTEEGIKFWSSLYIPIFFAMISKLNVYLAFSSGIIPVLISIFVVLLMFICCKYMIEYFKYKIKC